MANTLKFKRGLVSTIPTAALGEPLFTTDTFDLYIGNGTTNTRFQKYIASGTTSQLLRGDGSLLTMPIVLTSPANGEVLKYNGTNWVNDSDAGITGSGTTNYLPKFTSATTLGDSIFLQDGASTLRIVAANATVRLTGSREYLMQTVDANGRLRIYDQTGAAERLTLYTSGNFGVNTTSDNGLRFQVTGDGYFSGRLGIGTATPSEILHLSGNNSGSTSDSPIATIRLEDIDASVANNQPIGKIQFWANDATVPLVGEAAYILAKSAGSSGGGYMTFGTSDAATLATERMRITATGNVGIGTNTIDAANRLQVEGAYLSVRGTAGSGGGFYTSWPNTSNADARTWGWGSSINVFGDFGISQSNAKEGNPITAGTLRLYISRLGNLLLGSTTDNGLRFQVTGDAFIKGSGNTSATTALTVQNSDGTAIFAVRNDAQAGVVNVTNYTGRTLFLQGGFAASATIVDLNNSYTGTSGVINYFRAAGTFSPTSGNADYRGLIISPTINQTGGASGVTRGLLIAPTLTAAANWRSIEWSNNSGWGLYGVGSASNYVNGNIRVGSTTDISGLSKIAITIGSDANYGISLNNTYTATLNTGYFFRLYNSGTEMFNIKAVNTTSSNVALSFANNLEFQSGTPIGPVRMTLDASGNLGLGVVPSAWGGSFKSLDINTNGASLISTGTADARLYANAYYNGTSWIYKGSSLATGYQQGSGIHYWYTAPSGTAANAITWTTAMTLNNSGNLGLGVTPSAWGGTFKAIELTGGVSFSSLTSTTDIAYLTQNATNNGTSWIYKTTNAAGAYRLQSGSHSWFTAPSGTLNTAITFTQAMTLHPTGNLAIGTGGGADAGFKLDVNGTMRVSGASTFGGNLNLPNSGEYYLQNAASTTFIGLNFTSPYIRFGVNNTERMRIISNGDIGIGTNSPLYKLDVNGTMRVSGASTFNANATISLNQNNGTRLSVSNTTAGTLSSSEILLTSDASSGTAQLGKYSSTTTAFKILTPSSLFLYNPAAGGDIAILNNAASGTIKMAAGGSSTAHLTIASTGAATFSSSVTATRFVNTSQTAFILNNSGINNDFLMGSASSQFRIVDAAYAVTLFQITNTGAATFSSSIQAGTAIAIGTTPDTNKPFKILKNINGTVGINFENTSTGASAFSAIQMGTDVTGGTKFTNLVYSSSGVTASGVYQPDGTSLINNGSGGLNFLGNPIRFYTGGSNGVLRLYFDNEGTTQLNATSPTTSITDGYRQYSADVVAGNAAPHFRTENGAIIKLYQETTAVGSATIVTPVGSALRDTSTFDGYTLAQVVTALRNLGILA